MENRTGISRRWLSPWSPAGGDRQPVRALPAARRRGTGRPGRRPATSAGGCSSRASPSGRTGGQRSSRRRRCRRGKAYAPSVRAHCETVLRSFYDYHLEAGTGPIVNPFPLDRSRRGGRTRTTTRWSRSARRRPGATGRESRRGFPAASRMRSSTRSSPGCPRTGTAHWSRSTCPRAPARRSCCRPPRAGRTRGGS
jgi:hypothetical protein